MRFILAFVLVLPAVSLVNQAHGAKHHSDQQLRTMVRKKAPFTIQAKDVEIRINKDGTTTTGRWKVEKGLLKISSKDGAEEKSFPVDINEDKTPTIGGATLKSGRYVLE